MFKCTRLTPVLYFWVSLWTTLCMIGTWTEYRKSGNFRVVKFSWDKISSEINFVEKDELRKFVVFIFLNTRQKEASTEQDATLVIDSAIRPPQLDRLEPCWTMIQVYWPYFLPFSLLVTFSTSLIARAIASEGRREDNDPLGSGRLSFGFE